MKIQQFEYKPLSHYSYTLISEGEMVIIDPDRNPQQYYELAQKENASIKAVVLTHSHADFVSSHFQIHKETGAIIYNSKKMDAQYPHQTFDDGDKIKIGQVYLTAINTPGHSHDSISILAKKDDEYILFTGDTLFVGDVGRPDLRGDEDNKNEKRQELARAMFLTMQAKYNDLPDNTIVYPAHGEGSLCGKNMSSDKSSTLGKERNQNWAFNEQSEKEFVHKLLDAQPFIPAYFSHDVKTNRIQIETVQLAIAGIPFKMNAQISDDGKIIIDSRNEKEFKKGHLPGSINIMGLDSESPFETWLGTILQPDEKCYLVVDAPQNIAYMMGRAIKIGYEKNVKAIVTLPNKDLKKSALFNLSHFKEHQDNYTIVDVRNSNEVEEGKIFEKAVNRPLPELRDTADSIPSHKPIVVHCGSGYRSAIGSSILADKLNNVKVFDLGADIEKFK